MTRMFPVVLICLLGGSGCDEGISTVNWNQLDYQALRQDLEEPTGSVLGDDPEQTAEAIERSLGTRMDILVQDAQQLYNQIGVMIDVLEKSQDQVTGDETVGSGKTKGTSVYARVSCIGANPRNPITDFSDGEIHLEGPRFSLSDALKDNFRFEGSILARFNACRVADRIMAGDSPGFADNGEDAVAFELNLGVTETSGATHTAHYPVLFTRTGIYVLADTGADGTFVLSLEPGNDTALKITSAEGTFGCSVGVSGLTCDNSLSTDPQ